MIRIDERAVKEAAALIFAQPGVAEVVLQNPRADPRLRARLSRLVELERANGRQRVLFGEERPRALRH